MVALLPLTKKLLIFRWPASIFIIDAHNRACKGGNLAEADEDGLMDLALWGHECPTEQECQSAY